MKKDSPGTTLSWTKPFGKKAQFENTEEPIKSLTRRSLTDKPFRLEQKFLMRHHKQPDFHLNIYKTSLWSTMETENLFRRPLPRVCYLMVSDFGRELHYVS